MDALHELLVIDLVDVEIPGSLQGIRLLLHYEPLNSNPCPNIPSPLARVGDSAP